MRAKIPYIEIVFVFDITENRVHYRKTIAKDYMPITNDAILSYEVVEDVRRDELNGENLNEILN